MNTEDEEFERIEREIKMRALPDAIHHTDTSETLEYTQGWNDCRQAMLAEQPAQQEPVATLFGSLSVYDTTPQAQQEPEYTYTSTQATRCARCGKHKHTPLRIDSMGGYVCLTCIDQQLCTPQAQPAPVPGVVLRDGQPTLVRDRDIKSTDVRLCVFKENT